MMRMRRKKQWKRRRRRIAKRMRTWRKRKKEQWTLELHVMWLKRQHLSVAQSLKAKNGLLKALLLIVPTLPTYLMLRVIQPVPLSAHCHLLLHQFRFTPHQKLRPPFRQPLPLFLMWSHPQLRVMGRFQPRVFQLTPWKLHPPF